MKIMEDDMNERAEVGIFEVLLEPAKEAAAELLRDQSLSKAAVQEFAGFYVARFGDECVESLNVFPFEVDGVKFVLFETNNTERA